MIYILLFIFHLFGICSEDPTGQKEGCVICGKDMKEEKK